MFKKYFFTMTFVIILNLLALPVQADNLADHERQMKTYIMKSQNETLELLEKLVNVNSGTMNFAGVKAVADIAEQAFQSLGFTTKWLPMHEQVNRAGHLFAEHKANKADNNGKRMLLIGHLDTVFSEKGPFQSFSHEGNLVYGPGILDMKGGVIAMIDALKAMDAAGRLDDTNIIVALIGDEESSGDPLEITREALIEAATRSDIALAFEPNGSTDSNIAIRARRGINYWQITTQGKSGHSSLIFTPEMGQGAIFEMANILSKFQRELISENNYGVTMNPGLIVGGTEAGVSIHNFSGSAAGKRNVIAQQAISYGETRYISLQQCEEIKERMQEIINDTSELTNATIEFGVCKPAMEASSENQALLEQLSDISVALGYGPVTSVDPVTSGSGAADISTIAHLIPSLDGLGPAGSGMHTVAEQMQIDTLMMASQRAAILIDRLAHE